MIEIPPVEAPGITIPTNVFPLVDITIAGAPPILNELGYKLVPKIVTSVPGEPLTGVNEVMVGITFEIVRFNRTMLSHPATLYVVHVSTVLEEVYITPCHR